MSCDLQNDKILSIAGQFLCFCDRCWQKICSDAGSMIWNCSPPDPLCLGEGLIAKSTSTVSSTFRLDQSQISFLDDSSYPVKAWTSSTRRMVCPCSLAFSWINWLMNWQLLPPWSLSSSSSLIHIIVWLHKNDQVNHINGLYKTQKSFWKSTWKCYTTAKCKLSGMNFYAIKCYSIL